MHRFLRLALPCVLTLPIAAEAAKPEKKEGRMDNAPAAVFAGMDQDHDGVITAEEYIAAQKERLGQDGARTRFAELDKNHDGKLTKEEFGVGSDNADKKKDRAAKKPNKKNKLPN